MRNISNNYRDLLENELIFRMKKNRSYSLRAFARDIEIHASQLCMILKNTKGLSIDSAEKICRNLDWTKSDKEIFLKLVERNDKRLSKGKARLSHPMGKVYDKKSMTKESFALIADWYHYAILEIPYLKNKYVEFESIARALGIKALQVKSAINRLKKLNLIEMKANRFYPTSQYDSSPTEVPLEALKDFHCQIMDKAKEELYIQSLQERDYNTMVFAIDESKVSEAKAMLKEFRKKFIQQIPVTKDGSHIYCLSTQFFRLTKKLN